MRFMRTVCIAAAIVASASAVRAQDASKIGITMGYPASVGALWHVSDAIAIRPGIGIAGDSTNQSGVLTSSSHTFTVGADALFYLHTYDRLRTYVAPRLQYARGSTSTTANSTVTPAGGSFETVSVTNSGIQVGGAFGAQYGVSDHFAVFGETGFAYSHTTLTGSVSAVNLTSNAWGTRAGVGVIFWP